MIKVGICVAYDWSLLRYSLPAIYPYADRICLSLDKDLQSWNGNPFEIDRKGLIELIETLDKEKKIVMLEESFYSSERTPIANECYQRTRMSEYLGAADWYVQIDADEIMINPVEFLNVLKKHQTEKRPVNIHGLWINLIKQTTTGFVYSVVTTPPLATNKPVYEYGRTNGHFNIYTNTFLGHITWARPDEEVYYKLKNWGHSHEFNGLSFYKMWQALDEHNWKYLKDFHPMSKTAIPRLYHAPAQSIEEFIKQLDIAEHRLSATDMLNNNIWVSRFKKLLRKRP